MCCADASTDGSDSLEVGSVSRLFDETATAWLLSQAVRYLNTADKEGEFAYMRAIEVLRRCSADLIETVHGLFRQLKSGDTTLRWNLLYVLGDAGDARAADFLVDAALKPLPEVREDVGCETGRDMEMLVCTGAIHALHRVAARHPEAAESLLKIVSARPARPVLIEAVKVAADLGLREKMQHLLPKEDHWILDIRRARAQELFAEPEREDGKERGFTPPKAGSLYTAPRVARCVGKEK
jgi:hypothetical protein